MKKRMVEKFLEQRLEDFNLAFKIAEGKATQEDLKKFKAQFGYLPKEFNVIDWLNEYILSFSDDPYYRARRLELSTGGPADGFIFFENLELVKYYYQDWGWGIEIDIVPESPSWPIIEKLRAFLLEA